MSKTVVETAVKRICGVCGGKKPADKVVVISLTEEERQLIKESNGLDLTECVYCKPCHKVLTDSVTGPATLRGFVAISLKQLGLPDPQTSARNYVDKLVEASIRNKAKRQ